MQQLRQVFQAQKLLEQTLTGGLGDVSDHIVDGGVHILNRLEPSERPARRLGEKMLES